MGSLEYFGNRFIHKRPGVFFNISAFSLFAGFFALFIWGFEQNTDSIEILKTEPVELKYSALFEYSLRTLLRMMEAMVVSVVFSVIYATAAAKNKYCGQILVPLLDILQSVPILGYISFTVTAFLAMFPGNLVGAEMAAVFAIFTSQVWNMTFSFYGSLKSVPGELEEVAVTFGLSKWQKFWRLEVPYAVPSFVWNMALSMSGGWFFVVASEVITVGKASLTLPGIGSYISLALEEKNSAAVFFGVTAIAITIFLYDRLLMRPLVVWSDKFRIENSSSGARPRSLVLSIFYKSGAVRKISRFLGKLAKFFIYPTLTEKKNVKVIKERTSADVGYLPKIFKYLWYVLLSAFGILGAYSLFEYFREAFGIGEIIKVFLLTSATLLRIILLLFLASVIWVPIGISIGLNPSLASKAQPFIQFLAAFPINILFPVSVVAVTRFKLDPDIWLSLLMVMGTQWYILFNVIAGAASYPGELREASRMFGVSGIIWWRKTTLPAVTPAFLIGLVTASGNAWNTSILAEIVSYGGVTVKASGIGSYIAENTVKGDFHRIILGIFSMSSFVVFINWFLWRPLINFANKKYSLG